MSHPIVFLDIDGVLNTTAYIDRAIARAEASDFSPTTSSESLASLIDPERVELLNEIVEATGARVVASSDWRELASVSELEDILASRGFEGDLIDATPRMKAPRGEQIQAWLDAHPDVTPPGVFVQPKLPKTPKAIRRIAPWLRYDA